MVVALAMALSLFAAREAMRAGVIRETDAMLDQEVRSILRAIEEAHPDREVAIEEMRHIMDGHRARGWYVVWFDESHESTIWASDGAPKQMNTIPLGSGDGFQIWGGPGKRSVERRLLSPGLPQYLVRVGTNTEFIVEQVDQITRVFLELAIVIVVVAPLIGYGLARQITSPLRHVISLTEKLGPAQMDRRLPISGIGDELDQLSEKINSFLDQIAEHLKRKREFVANAAHELKSPLAAMQTSIQVTVDKQRTPHEYEDALFQLADQCAHLSRLISQLLMLAKSESSKSNQLQEKVSLPDIITSTVEMFAPVAEDKSIQLTVEHMDPVDVKGDSGQLRQVLTNLVDNAIKFTPKEGRVTIRLTNQPETGNACLIVSDTGCGIPADSLPLIFDRFYQVEGSRSRDDENRGTGLGLSICQAIVRVHQGKITTTSEVGKGTTFTVMLPAI